jgi:hypothetical protein
VKRRWFLLALAPLGLLTIPAKDNSARYVRWQDQAKARSRILSAFWGKPCTHSASYTTPDGQALTYYEFDSSPACIRFDPSRRFAGIWLDVFEGSDFYEGRTALPPPAQPEDAAAWLTMPEQVKHGLALGQSGHGRFWRITFIGRQSSVKGHYGHFGMWPSEIVVEKILSAEALSTPPNKITPRSPPSPLQ